jgi:MFS family permease
MMTGNLVFSAVISAKIRDLTPKENIGHFQGVRMIFYVLIPMVVGPFVGSAVIKNSGQTYEDLGVLKEVPTPAIFLASAIALFLIILPLILALKKSRLPESSTIK